MTEVRKPGKLQLRMILLVGMVVLAAGARFLVYLKPQDATLPWLWNFTPIAALA
jgi:hypothetical protein